MRLVIFDVDGTLTETQRLDEDCFIKTFETVFAGINVDRNWNSYPSATDSAITHCILEKYLERPPTAEEISLVKQAFFKLLSKIIEQNGVREVKGASAVLEQLKKDPEWITSVATGCWLDSALLKLRSANINVDGICLSTADDTYYREDIIKRAIEQCPKRPEKIIYVGDAIWDLEATRKIGISFIGIGQYWMNRTSLNSFKSFADYSNTELFINELNRRI